ncbi:MAG: hypothetical protein DRJ50_10810, partial [Actinobacteria bacterium]
MTSGNGRTVAANLLWCVPGQVGGSEQYLVRQLLGLAAQDSDFDVTLYCLPQFVDAHPELSDRYQTVAAGISGTTRMSRIAYENTWLARQTTGVDLVHHGGGTAPMVGARPIVLTIHDLQYLTYPDYVSPTKLRYLKAMVPRAVRRAEIVAVPTDYVRGTVVDSFEIDADR